MDAEEQISQGLLAPSQEFLASVKVFPLIPYLKKDVINTIDSPLSWEQLTASDINFAIVRPLVTKYAKLRNMAIVYACMVVRSYFLAQSGSDLAHAGVMYSRATLCEIMALKLLSHFASSKIQLVAVLTTLWCPLAGAPDDVIEEVKDAIGGEDEYVDDPQCAIEMAIATKAKTFLASAIVQSVVTDIYNGRIIVSIAGNRSMVPDNYKQRAIMAYDPRTAPMLDHYRLRVPRYSAILHFVNIAVLLVVFLACIWNVSHVTPWESVFLVFAIAFTLQEYTASKEYGWAIYIANIWNVFDTSFVIIFLGYLVLRVKGLWDDDAKMSQLAFDLLACGCCVLAPRLAFYAINNNVVVLALRAMIAEFIFFIGIAAVCFSGILLTLYTLGTWTIRNIAWLMVQIWFGYTYLSFAQAKSFHPVFGPILMTFFAALSGTLLLTILISILSNTAARIDANATQEFLFQCTISTIQGVKSDALFSYQPPFNILAFVILKPASYILSPRSLHSANVFLIRLTSFPVLIAIALYERLLASEQRLRESGRGAARSLYHSIPRHIKNMPFVDYFVGSKSADLYEAIFEVEDSRDFELFDDSEVDETSLRSLLTSRHEDSGSSPISEPRRHKRSASLSKKSQSQPPRTRKVSALPALSEPSGTRKILRLNTSTPVTSLFLQRFNDPSSTPPVEMLPDITNMDRLDSSINRIEALLEDCRELPVRKLKDEMKDLQDRQARIENILLALTRGMRHETEILRYNTV
ncbi:uncharacterized protein F5891DRAFT_1189806 [Suillus fuscotomentosus]|uniref:Receptor-activated Ca2+-permeable cation channel n=1 Tax=Suillus fuscotomentosus TaxID=1912939 RepID=A0AAD4E6Q7_9AGAM|nr:uncharacterized protein F5891DRAFT_1189806 [Suillus fuscotomentosus]KAG1899358.1 hypothetical protein F5891DRAFT_1189806 [Suillus fuscotomentosus]